MNFIITGGSRGLGFEIAEMAKSFNGKIALIAKDQDRLNKAKAELAYENVNTYSCDFSIPREIEKLITQLKKDFKSVDVLINNVGSFEVGELSTTKIKQVEKLLNVNFKATFNITQAYLNDFKNQQSGSIINIGSIVTEQPRKDIAAYTISKFALQGYTKLLCDELKDYGVKVTEVIPGSINTSSWDGIDAPKQDFVQPADIVNTIKMVINSSKGANFEQIIVRPTNRNF
jgi:short-subunit dehydrogenase